MKNGCRFTNEKSRLARWNVVPENGWKKNRFSCLSATTRRNCIWQTFRRIFVARSCWLKKQQLTEEKDKISSRPVIYFGIVNRIIMFRWRGPQGTERADRISSFLKSRYFIELRKRLEWLNLTSIYSQTRQNENERKRKLKKRSTNNTISMSIGNQYLSGWEALLYFCLHLDCFLLA